MKSRCEKRKFERMCLLIKILLGRVKMPMMCTIIKFSTQLSLKILQRYIYIDTVYILLFYMSPQPLRGEWCAQCLENVAHGSLPTLGNHNHRQCVLQGRRTLGPSVGCVWAVVSVAGPTTP